MTVRAVRVYLYMVISEILKGDPQRGFCLCGPPFLEYPADYLNRVFYQKHNKNLIIR